ncbi:hypothetical protein FIBSPDRAFT_894856 [Athelia psychrophila]|uniref:Uncharacterized protein n=1 Tax=Athelia psychrophila TaxID=1759441 RepID=A0A166FFD9_9AGAM|nr:hypothetical protein FIBSPDRAFT_894856 [Fibularhizoctonia sp. CBS 109695]
MLYSQDILLERKVLGIRNTKEGSVWCRLARGRTFGTGLVWYLLARKQRGTPAQHGNGWPGGRWGNRLSVAWAGQRVVSKTVQHRTGWPGGRWGNQLSVAWAGQRVLFKSVQHRVGWPDQDLMSSPTLKTSLFGTLAPDGAWIPTGVSYITGSGIFRRIRIWNPF